MTKFNDLDITEFRRRATDLRARAKVIDDPMLCREYLMVAEAWDQFIADVLASRQSDREQIH